MNNIPIIDLRDSENPELLQALDAACRDHGFFLLSGHGQDKAIARMWRQAGDFFASPRNQRLQIERSADNPLGYYDRELTKRKRDLKEVFDFTRPSTDSRQYNRWPEQMPEFRQGMSDYYEAMSELAEKVLALLHRALGLEDFALHGDANTSNARLNNYPVDDPLSASEQADTTELGDMALHHHTDPGLVTLLVQDDTGGLQTLSTEHGWIDVPPIQGTIIVNLGDSIQAWTNDIYKAAVHRVVPMTRQARKSTPYFYHPARDAIIQPHSQLANGKPHYRAFSWKEFIQSRVDDNYSDLGEADTQVSNYRI